MLNLWKRRQRKGRREAEETFLDPDMGESTPSGAPNDTIKLVTPEGDKDELAVQDEPKPEADSVTEPILLPPSDTTSPADLGGDSRELSVSSDGSLASDKTELCKTKKRPGISGVKWAEEPAEVKSCETFPVESPKDEDHEKTVPSPECTGSDISDSMSQPLCHEEGLSSKTPIWLPLQDETKQSEDGENKTPNMSSADTDEGDTDSAPTKVPRVEQGKHDRTKRFPRTSPALRKDSIDVYKKRKQGQYPGAPRLLLNLGGQKSAAEEEKPESEAGTNGTTGAPPGATDLPSPSILKRRSSILKIDKEVRQGVFTVLSGMYAMFLTILGAVLPVAEVFADQKHPLLFEVFYIYMYGGSILFLGYVYTYLLRTRATQKPEPQPQHKKKRRKRRVSVDKVSSHTGSFYLRLGAVAFGIGSMIHSGLQFGDYFEVEASDPCGHAVFAFRPMVHLIFTFVQLYFVFMNSKMCINRYKVIARFGLMHMVATNMCVWFNTIVEETLHQFKLHETDVDHTPLGANPLHSHPQLQTNHTLLADSRRNASSLGRGHGARDVHETAAPLLTTTLGHILGVHTHHHNVTHAGDAALSVPLMTVTPPPAATCHTSQLMMTVLETVGPYLYPCTIEYSLICAGIIYTLWKNIGKRVMSIKCDDGSDEPAQAQRLRVDCSNSSRGLFVGILILVGTIITVVVFFVLVKTPSFNQSAMLVEYLSEILLFAVSSVAVIIAALRMRYLRFNSARDTDFEEVLILISLAGDYMFQMLSLVAAIFDRELFASRLSITACLLGIGQSTLQTMFVLDGLRRSCRTTEQGTKKQGRELVTFLLISNIALWCINTFEAERTVANPVQMHYYGALAWNILTHISIPLGIFFRFHSTVCLSNIWKRAWKSYP